MAIDVFGSHTVPDPPNLPLNHSCYAKLRGNCKTNVIRELPLHKYLFRKGGALLMSILFCGFFSVASVL